MAPEAGAPRTEKRRVSPRKLFPNADFSIKFSDLGFNPEAHVYCLMDNPLTDSDPT
jgi:hypothetical protein